MYIKEIDLKNFRNYKTLSVKFDPQVNVFYGQNAQGKTNLLESIYLTSMGKSFRTGKDKEMIQFESDFFRIKVKAVKQEKEEITVELAVNRDGKKGIKIDGVKAKKISQLFENIYIVVFSPEDLRIIKDEPEKRRKFIDRELCQVKPLYYNNLNQYKKALLQRNAYLKEIHIDESVLDIWDIKLSEYGSKLISARDDFVKKLDKISSSIHNGITAGKEKMHISYEPSIPVCKDIQKMFYEEIKKNRKKDLKNRTTVKGPHKDDIKLQVNDMDIRHFGSQGQQRTAALSLKLSEIRLIKEETGENPVLLLDDVLSELDSQRQQYLISSLENTQIFITTTEISTKVEESLPHIQYFYIDSGEIKKIQN